MSSTTSPMWDGWAHADLTAGKQSAENGEAGQRAMFQDGLKRNWVAVESA
jgi:hypothetical protein